MDRGQLIERIREAHDVFRRLPDPEKRFLRPKYGTWPLFARDFVEAYGYNDARVRLSPPSPSEIDRAMETVDWFARYLSRNTIEAKVVWLCCGRGISFSQVAYVLRVSPTTVRRHRDAGIAVLVYRLTQKLHSDESAVAVA
jgi:hypothetical protein